MKKLISLAVNYPRQVLLFLGLVSLVSMWGTTRLRMDTTTETLLPRSNRAYFLLQQSKRIFGDGKTFLITAIEPRSNQQLLSPGTFRHLLPLIAELEELKTFNRERANRRLNAILALSGVTVIPAADSQAGGDGSGPPAGLDTPQLPDLDAKNPAPQHGTDDIWQQQLPPASSIYAKSIRPRNSYEYGGYKPVTLAALRGCLDPVARRHFDTLVSLVFTRPPRADEPLDCAAFRKFLEGWETLYLHSSMDIIKTILDPFTTMDISGTGDSIKAVSLLPRENGQYRIPSTAAELAEYRKRLLYNPAWESVLYARDGQGRIAAFAMCLTMRPLENLDWIFDFLHKTIDKYDNGPVQLTQMGAYMYQKYLREFMQNDLKNLVPLVLIVIVLTFYFNFRTWKGVILPTASVLLATLWTFGLMGFLGIPITLVVNLLPPLLLAVGSSYSIHILNQYYLDAAMIHKARDRKKALTGSMLSISLTVLLAALTTFIGFLTLVANEMSSLQHFGIFAAVGTFFAMVIATLFIPAVLVFQKKSGNVPVHKGPNKRIQAVVNCFARLSIRHPRVLFAVILIILAVFGFGLSRLYVESSAAYLLKKSSFLYKADIHLGNLFKGHMIVNLVFDSGKKGGALEPQFLKMVEEFRTWAVSPYNRTNYHILHTLSLGDVIKSIHRATSGGSMDAYRIPDARVTIEDYLQLYGGRDSDGDGRPDGMEQFLDPGKRFLNVLVRKGSQGNNPISTSQSAAGQEAINRYLEKHARPLGYTWEATGEPLLFVVLGEMVIQGQVISILLTLLLIAVIIIVLFRNLISGLISLIPISVSIVFVYGLMGFLGIPLDIPKTVLAAIAIGIGIDNTIHILKTLRRNLCQGCSMDDAIVRTHNQAGLPVVYTSVALVLGFSVFLFSEFVPVFYLGLLVALAMMSTTVTALLLLPAAANLTRRQELHKGKEWKIFRHIRIAEYFDREEKE